VALAHNLGMDVIAEGVETAQQLAQLKTLGCEYAQGYYFGKPADQETAWAMLAAAAEVHVSPMPGHSRRHPVVQCARPTCNSRIPPPSKHPLS
jgi:predicted signal transduction protein with EAL and GGDEF domain